MGHQREIDGMEFDWFASDPEGAFAVFATAGFGPVPDSVREAIASHDAIGDSIEVINWGSCDIWQSFSSVGLFVYDWSVMEGRYLRVAEPTVALRSDLAANLRVCPGLPKFRFSFFQATAVESTWQSSA